MRQPRTLLRSGHRRAHSYGAWIMTVEEARDGDSHLMHGSMVARIAVCVGWTAIAGSTNQTPRREYCLRDRRQAMQYVIVKSIV